MLVIFATHPIQYQVPIWKELAKRLNVEFEVWYLTSHGVEPSYDIQFAKTIKWDIDLLDGYPYRFSQINCPKRLTNFWSAKLPKDFKSRLKNKEITHILLLGWNVVGFIEAIFIAFRCRKKIWLRAESNDLKVNSFFKKQIKNLFLKLFFSKIEKFLTIGNANKRLYKNLGITEDKIYSAPYCVENQRFAFQANKNLNSRKKFRSFWGIDDASFCILFIGKFMKKKNPRDIIDAVKILKNIDIKSKYHILYVGAGELEDLLKQNSNVVFDGNNMISNQKNNKILPLTSFTGFINQSKVSEAYIAADLLVLPSDADETWGLVVNEAMASGLPCVVSDACGSSEDLVSSIDPMLSYSEGNIESLANSIKYASQNLPSKMQLKKQINAYDFTHTVKTLEYLWALTKEK